jgi:uncharacterized membrane protein YfcA
MFVYIACALIYFLAGFVQGVTGFGSALVAVPLLTFLIDIKVAVPLSMLNGLLITLFLSVELRRHIDWRKIAPLFIGSLPGILVGIALFKKSPSTALRVLLGIVLIVYGIYRLAGRAKHIAIHRKWGYLAGFATGLIGVVLSTGGPPTIFYATRTGWNKDDIKATLSGFFFASGLFTVVAHALSGVTSVAVLRYFAFSALFVLAGVFSGSTLSSRLGTDRYIRIVLIWLLILGFVMIMSA